MPEMINVVYTKLQKIWGFEDLRIWGFGDLRIWGFKNGNADMRYGICPALHSALH
jgi:hypothetical protein